MGIRAKLILSTCLPLLVIYVVVLGWDYVKSRAQALKTIEQLVAQRASADASQVNNRLLAIQQTVNRTAYALANRSSLITGTTTNRPADTEAAAEPTLGPPPDASIPREVGPRRLRGGQNLNGFLAFNLSQSDWIGSIVVKLERGVAPGRPTIYAERRTAGDRPINAEPFRPSPLRVETIARTAAASGRGVWIEPNDLLDLDPDAGPSCLFAEPFYSPDEGKLLGVVCVSVPLDTLRFLREDSPVQVRMRRLLGDGAASRPATDAAREPRTLASGGYLLLDRQGHILSRPDGRVLHTPLAVGPDAKAIQAAIDHSLAGQGDIVVAGGLDEVLGQMAPRSRYVLAMESLPATGWLYVTAAPESDLLGPVQDRLVNRGMFLGASLVVLVGVVTIVLTRFCRPIEQMAHTVQRLASGDLNIAPVPVTARDELGQLAKGFNDMTGRLRHHVRELTEQTAEREKVDSELRIARQIQSDLLPRTFPPFPDRQEFGLHAVNIPARHIAGDFFDFFFGHHDKLTVVIADVSGKGVPAALMMAVTRTMVRNLAESDLSPREIVERVNRMLVEDTTPGLFVTMMLGQYEPHTGRLTYVNAGHPPAILVSRDASHKGTAATCCPPTGPLLGVDATGLLGPFDQETITLAPGDTVLLYTDGVTEAHDETHVLYGEARLIARAKELATAEPPDLCEGVVSTVMAYQHQSAADDLTLVALHRR